MVKQKSEAMLKHIQPLSPGPPSPAGINRNSSLDEHDYVDYIFTPSTEYKPPLSLFDRHYSSSSNSSCNNNSNGLFSTSTGAERDNVGRTFSLPPILENKRAEKTRL